MGSGQKIRKGDIVAILGGRDRGRTGEVLRVIPSEGKAVVAGVNTVVRHTKQTPQQEGGVIKKEAPIAVCKLALIDPVDGKPVRVGYRILDDGRKVRYAKRSGEIIDV